MKRKGNKVIFKIFKFLFVAFLLFVPYQYERDEDGNVSSRSIVADYKRTNTDGNTRYDLTFFPLLKKQFAAITAIANFFCAKKESCDIDDILEDDDMLFDDVEELEEVAFATEDDDIDTDDIEK